MNELIFFLAIILVSASALAALRWSKEALVALICLEWVLANLFVTKQISLFGLNATACDTLVVGATLSLNLLQEFWGRAVAQKTVWLSFGLSLFYLCMASIHVLYTPSIADSMHPYFATVLLPMPRIIAASLVTYLFVQQLDVHFFGCLRKRFSSIPLAIANGLSITVTQLIDTILFSFLGLYGIISSIGQVILISFSIKLIVILLTTPFVACARVIKK